MELLRHISLPQAKLERLSDAGIGFTRCFLLENSARNTRRSLRRILKVRFCRGNLENFL